MFLDPIVTNTESDYKSVCDRMRKSINDERASEVSGLKRFLPFNQVYFDSLSYEDQREYSICHKHELAMFQLGHKKCYKCLSVSLMKNYSQCKNDSNLFLCSECKQKDDTVFYQKDCNRLLPVWYDESGAVQFELPTELKDLRLGEQLLIQRFSCYVPLVHIRNGVMGLKGHCCCFKQEISEICNSLPRTNVNAVKVVKSIRDSLGNNMTKAFFIRREKVMDALKWLKKYHKWYREDPNLVIDENNLQWMNGADECELRDLHVIDDDSSPDQEDPPNGLSSDLFNDEMICGDQSSFGTF
jgi:hypothetical protein